MESDFDDVRAAFAAATGTATDMDLQPGMSLRDWFACQATDVDVMRHREFDFDPDTMIKTSKYTAEQARYRFADAMLEARKIRPEEHMRGR
ncbi:hypothetical protein [Phaeobacter gallaeciensis]|nr:hypothetical protein [Phaeobacter gallaeciensis]MDE4189623.1 hypothetical protein [Phaeobacter gallaeciensis]MDE4198775.1 hypothetical protein [Phaeobacter gallaeciensis]MDE4202920.1 hypothetical protein [Phaeobacter gallaeciensis]MDE4215711.1 hypothetical protein [Phaeobacter gallaeciensis]MDE4220439.1 hypothetical protein [Phaeobacter gallaeciensis]